ncbi:hypothetical protein [Polycladidibacter stylochi]|uniref:hypothetical protein n=1 Tax=Polycladidibacter stylochi TaxID=1807766 RepID=UPI00083403D3|nr:hypothetical protein [Pseudovibrio stylochi]
MITTQMTLRYIIVFCVWMTGFSIGSVAQAASSSCRPSEAGTWVNEQARPKQLSGLQIEAQCSGIDLSFRARAFTRCAPRDCKWGFTKGKRRQDGVLQFLFTGFFSSKTIVVRPMGQRLEVSVTTHFDDPSKPQILENYILEKD